MKNYKIELVSTGVLTQLPDSQKLFGALMYMFSEVYGSNKTTILTRALLDKKIHLTLSNVMPSGYLPVPQDYLIDRISGSSDMEASRLKERRTAIKERSYIKITDLEYVLETPENCEHIFPYIKIQNQQQRHASIESIRYDIPELDSKLYSVPIVVLLEIDVNEKKRQKAINTFCFYLQADDSNIDADMLDMLNKAAMDKRTIILGQRASQGLNTFKILDITEQNLQRISTNRFLNMGMLLPDKINFASSTLKLYTSERRPFEMAGGWEKDFTGYYISFIAEGSIISVHEGSVSAGKSIKSPFNEKRDIVFGNAFLYPISPDKGEI